MIPLFLHARQDPTSVEQVCSTATLPPHGELKVLATTRTLCPECGTMIIIHPTLTGQGITSIQVIILTYTPAVLPTPPPTLKESEKQK